MVARGLERSGVAFAVGRVRLVAVLSEGKRAPEEPQPDERGMAVVYKFCMLATHFYRIMTRNDRIPVLIEERI
jgi:hypothetical protein